MSGDPLRLSADLHAAARGFPVQVIAPASRDRQQLRRKQ
jgi:hypothetical protein